MRGIFHNLTKKLYNLSDIELIKGFGEGDEIVKHEYSRLVPLESREVESILIDANTRQSMDDIKELAICVVVPRFYFKLDNDGQVEIEAISLRHALGKYLVAYGTLDDIQEITNDNCN